MTRTVLLALCLMLAACDNQSAAPADEDAGATAEVLKGSVSDAMIPLEELDSQAPLAPRAAQDVDADVDAAQPEVTPVPGVDAAPAPAPADTPTAAPQADQPQP
ncbi:hypothetical protein [Erythrobacter neustonensis]|nr:hypothetical protein [Erythrobacter neustonensis]